MTTWIILVLVFAVVIFVVMTYNNLVQKRNQVENAWSQIDVQLKRRIELIPNLVETVKGYASFEQKTLQDVISARNLAMAAPNSVASQAGADNALSGALRQLFALSESYPDLKANASFLNLQEELSNTESRIAYARQFFNDAVLTYNNAVHTFPSVIFASLFKFEDSEFFEATDVEKSAPKVQF
ncbi:MAG: LemA family protein [Actinomycetota bacterium]